MPHKLALIGLGKIAQDQHLPCVDKNPDFELAAVVSSRPSLLKVPAFRTADELFATGLRLDAVSLCMPPEPRTAIALAALDHGLNVLMEKPPTPTVGELQAIVARATERRRVLFTTWHSQFNAAVDEARRRLEGRKVRRLHVEWKEDVRHWHPGQEWIWAPGGFGVFDPGINAFSIVTRILPAPIFVAAARLETPANRQTPIAAEIRFKPSWAGDAELTASLDWRQTGPQTWDIRIETTEGNELVLRKGGTELHVDGALAVSHPSQEYEAIYARFAELLRSGRSEIDAAPLQLVSDCFMIGERVETEAFV